MCVCVLSRFFRVWLCATQWTLAHQAPLSMEFSRQEYWSGLPFPSPGDLLDPGIEHVSLESPALAGGFFTTEPLGKPFVSSDNSQMNLLLVKWDINKYAQNWSGHIIISICGGYRARQTNDSRSRNLLSFPSWHCDLPRLSKEQPFLFYFLDAWPWLRRMSLKCLWNCYFRRKESRS